MTHGQVSNIDGCLHACKFKLTLSGLDASPCAKLNAYPTTALIVPKEWSRDDRVQASNLAGRLLNVYLHLMLAIGNRSIDCLHVQERVQESCILTSDFGHARQLAAHCPTVCAIPCACT